eukprot:scaffold73827_cov32-Prasinocladus_malaysianus.AAC.1
MVFQGLALLTQRGYMHTWGNTEGARKANSLAALQANYSFYFRLWLLFNLYAARAAIFQVNKSLAPHLRIMNGVIVKYCKLRIHRHGYVLTSS